jgi:hypothetical protein
MLAFCSSVFSFIFGQVCCKPPMSLSFDSYKAPMWALTYDRVMFHLRLVAAFPSVRGVPFRVIRDRLAAVDRESFHITPEVSCLLAFYLELSVLDEMMKKFFQVCFHACMLELSVRFGTRDLHTPIVDLLRSDPFESDVSVTLGRLLTYFREGVLNLNEFEMTRSDNEGFARLGNFLRFHDSSLPEALEDVPYAEPVASRRSRWVRTYGDDVIYSDDEFIDGGSMDVVPEEELPLPELIPNPQPRAPTPFPRGYVGPSYEEVEDRLQEMLLRHQGQLVPFASEVARLTMNHIDRRIASQALSVRERFLRTMFYDERAPVYAFFLSFMVTLLVNFLFF